MRVLESVLPENSLNFYPLEYTPLKSFGITKKELKEYMVNPDLWGVLGLSDLQRDFMELFIIEFKAETYNNAKDSRKHLVKTINENGYFLLSI